MKRSCHCEPYPIALALLAAALILSPLANAAVEVSDRWRADGLVELKAGGVTVAIKRGGPITMTATVSPKQTAACSISLLSPAAQPATTATCKVSSQSAPLAKCAVTATSPAGNAQATVEIDRDGELVIRPGTGCRGVHVEADYAFAVLPSRHVDDCIYDARSYPKTNRLYLPSESLLMGLVRGGNAMVVLGWPPAAQAPSLLLSGSGENRRIRAMELLAVGQPIYVGLLTAPGIWHEVALDESFEERDVQLKWTIPFKARWKVQLKELGVPTTYFWVAQRRRRWRPTINWYIVPLFSRGKRVFLHVHKQMDCSGCALIYALDNHQRTPYAFLARHLPSEARTRLLELSPTHYVLGLEPKPGPGRLIDTHCYGRNELQYTTFAVGNQGRERDFLRTHVLDRRIECLSLARYSFQRALDWMNAMLAQLDIWLKGDENGPAVRDYLLGLKKTLSDMQAEYHSRLGGKSTDHVIRSVERAVSRFLATLNQDAGIELCPELLHYINQLNQVISMNEDLSRRFGTWARKLFQQAAYQCVTHPAAARYAEAVRQSIRQQLQYRSYESAARVYDGVE